jgi:hypothetical protein
MRYLTFVDSLSNAVIISDPQEDATGADLPVWLAGLANEKMLLRYLFFRIGQLLGRMGFEM